MIAQSSSHMQHSSNSLDFPLSDGGSTSSIVDVIKESITEIQSVNEVTRHSESHSRGQPVDSKSSTDPRFKVGGEHTSSSEPVKSKGAPRVMKVTCSQVRRTNKSPKWLYPYEELQPQTQAYRGYPLDWTDSMKREGFVIQLVSPAVGPPTRPMAAFPPAVLVRDMGDEGRYCPGELTHHPMPMSETMIANNTAGSASPSEWYYAAGLEAPPYRVRKFIEELGNRRKSASSVSVADAAANVQYRGASEGSVSMLSANIPDDGASAQQPFRGEYSSDHVYQGIPYL